MFSQSFDCLETARMLSLSRVFLPMLGCQLSGAKGAFLQARDYNVSSQYLSAYFCSASYFPLSPAVGQKHTNIPFPNGEIPVYDMAPLFTLQPKGLSSFVPSFLVKVDKQQNSIKYSSPLFQCL